MNLQDTAPTPYWPGSGKLIQVVKLSSYPPGVGGGELQTHALSRTLRSLDVQVRVIDTRGEASRRQCQRWEGIPVLRYPTPGIRGLDPLFQMAEISCFLKRLSSHGHLLQVNHLGPALLPALARGRARHLKVILVPWGSCRPGVGPFRHGLLHALLRSAARRSDAVVALSQGMALHLTRLWRFPAERIRVIPNGVDTVRFRPGRDDPPPALAPKSGPLVLTTGRLVPAKRFDLLLAAWTKISQRQPAARLVILGEGPDRLMLENLVRTERLAASVRLPGAQSDVERWLAAADLFVSSSQTEGMSNAILEAMSAGLPVVATRVSGSEDLVEEAKTGFLVPAGNAAALATGLEKLLAAPGLREQMGLRGRQRIETSFSLAAVALRYRHLYEELT